MKGEIKTKAGSHAAVATPRRTARPDWEDAPPAPELVEFVKALARDLARSDAREDQTTSNESGGLKEQASNRSDAIRVRRAGRRRGD